MVLLIFCTIQYVSSALLRETQPVDWFGDQRHSGDTHAFYDLSYDDDSFCPGELKSFAVSDYVYLGPLAASFQADSANHCLEECLHMAQCQSVNYYSPGLYTKQGFCELITGSHKDQPSWMRRYAGAVYYENISCDEFTEYADYTDEKTTVPQYAKKPFFNSNKAPRPLHLQQQPHLKKPQQSRKIPSKPDDEKTFMVNFLSKLSDHIRASRN